MWMARLALGAKCGQEGSDSPGTAARSVPSRSINEAAAAPARPPPTQEKKPRRSVHIEELVAVEEDSGQGVRAEFFDQRDGLLSLLEAGLPPEGQAIGPVDLEGGIVPHFPDQPAR